MAAPVEFRQYIRKFTLADARNSIQPIKLPTGPAVDGQQPFELFVPQPILQFRYKEKVFLNGAQTLEWSPWADVGFVKEGDEEVKAP